MPKRIPDEELMPAQLKERERRRLYCEKNREQIRARKRQYYVAHADAYKERAKRYYNSLTAEQKMDLERARKPSRKAWCDRNREHLADKRQQYYAENKERMKTVVRRYYKEHVEVLSEKRAVAYTEKVNARQMCPAFRFVEYLRLKNNARFVVVYKPHTNLAHLAAKTCGAIKAGDFHMCPICRTPRMHNVTMKSACPMPHVFEFEDAIAQIRKFAKQIVAENKR